MKQLIILTVFILFQVSVFGQSINNSCGTQLSQSDYNDIKATLLARGSLGSTDLSRANTIEVRLKPHIIRRSNGTGGLSLADLQTSIQQLSNNFLQAGIRFEMCSVNYIDDDLFFDAVTKEPSPNADYNLARPNIEINAVNVFFVPRAVFQNDENYRPYPFNWSYFPRHLNSNLNWTIISKDYATDGGTLAHEIGHYFNLLHTHHVRRDIIGNILGFEHVTRNSLKGCLKNCDTEGDLLCDTPADPDLGGETEVGDTWPPTAKHVDSNCNYNPKSKFRDDCNAEYIPDTHNIMSYAYHCRTHFSNGQIARMREAITLDRPEVVIGPSSNLTITSIIANGKQAFNALNSITAYNTIEASGKGIYTAGYEITLSPNFTSKIGSEFDAFISNCNGSFTAVAAGDIKKNNKQELYPLQELDVSIYPIPVKDKATIAFNLQNDVDNIDIGLYDLAGFMVKKLAKDSSYKKGEHTLTLDASKLTPKVYVIIFNTSEGERITKKIIVR